MNSTDSPAVDCRLHGAVGRPEPERDAFEAAMAAEGYHLNPQRYRDGSYRDTEYAAAWRMWCKAALRVTVTARAIEWDQDSGFQWTDRHYGFSIIEEPGDELPFSAAWGEGDTEQFATLDEAQAWCKAEIDRWIEKYAVLTPNVPLEPPAEGRSASKRLLGGS